jgi:hypothetical protein
MISKGQSKNAWRLVVGLLFNLLTVASMLPPSFFFPHLMEFLWALIPSITIVFLVPVIIHGSHWYKVIAVVLLLLPAWVAFWGWQMAIDRFMDYYLGH